MNATERQISRRGMGYGLRALGRLAASAAEKSRWIDMSNAIRPTTLF